MAVFADCFVVLDLKDLPFKEKKKVRLAITDNGGTISYVVNKQCSLVVVSCLGNLSSNRQRSARKLQVPVVGLAYLWACLEKSTLLPPAEHILLPLTTAEDPAPSSTSRSVKQVASEEQPADKQGKDPPQRQTEKKQAKNDANYVCSHRIYSENDKDLPEFPSHFQVAKYCVFAGAGAADDSGDWCVMELQSAVGEKGRVFQVVRYMKKQGQVVRDQLVWCGFSEDALEVYQAMQQRLTDAQYQPRKKLTAPHRDLGSPALSQLLLEEDLHCSSLSKEVGIFVELVWTEALGSLTSVLKVPALSISPNDVGRAEGLLLQVRRVEGEEERRALLEEVLSVLPHTLPDTLPTAKLVSQALDLCQVLRDMLAVNETVMRSSSPSSLGKYRALGCSIQTVSPESSDYHTLTQMLQHSDIEMHIQDVFHVQRAAELQMFREELGNVRPLLHSTSPASFVGILSRGLLLPRVGVERHGVERTDIGFLGGGIYFSDSFSTSVKYSKPSEADGSRLLLVCEVALGHCRDVRKRDTTLTAAPDGYHSMHGVRSTPNQHSEFEDDEYVVYSPDQVRLKYVVQYTLPGDEGKVFQPQVDTSVESAPSGSQANDTLTKYDESEKIEDIENPLDSMAAGLLDSAGQKLPLQAVHVKCKLVDLLSQVIIFQTYSNPSPVPIEAKYVFPLEETAAVCGFEAFINGKHVIGEVKEKEQARKEYKQAIAKGHGAYLMDQEAPDVFTISVGNLPPGATVLIKVTFLSELLVTNDAISFQLPGSVAPWQQSSALNERTQSTVEKVCVSEHSGDFSLSLSMEMPYEIEGVFCPTHKTEIKKTQCKGVVRTLPGETMSSDGFHLFIHLREMHMPRMWVENHPDKDSQACMLVFFPDLEALRGDGDEGPWPVSGPASGGVEEVVILVDSSESMRGESLISARRIAAYMIKYFSYVHKEPKINVILFGTDQQEAFALSKDYDEASDAAKYWIWETPAVGGSTELWRPLRSLSLLPPSRGSRSVVLLSDGHVQNPALTLQLARSNAAHTRIFTCGLSKTANKHTLRALAQASGGAYEFFDTKTRHTWSKKVESLVGRMTSPGCGSVSVKWQLFNPRAPPPVQAPAQVHALFSKHHTLVYGFVPHCTQATLYGDLCGKELKTMVSTTELQKTKGTFLHKLTARAVIRDYEDGILHLDEAEHEGKKAEMKSFIVDLSKEFSILSQFTSFVAIEERDPEKPDKGFTDIPKLIADEDVDLLPYMGWKDSNEEWEKDRKRYSTKVVYQADADYSDDDSDDDMDFGLFDYEDIDQMVSRAISCPTAMSDVEEDNILGIETYDFIEALPPPPCRAVAFGAEDDEEEEEEVEVRAYEERTILPVIKAKRLGTDAISIPPEMFSIIDRGCESFSAFPSKHPGIQAAPPDDANASFRSSGLGECSIATYSDSTSSSSGGPPAISANAADLESRPREIRGGGGLRRLGRSLKSLSVKAKAIEGGALFGSTSGFGISYLLDTDKSIEESKSTATSVPSSLFSGHTDSLASVPAPALTPVGLSPLGASSSQPPQPPASGFKAFGFSFGSAAIPYHEQQLSPAPVPAPALTPVSLSPFGAPLSEPPQHPAFGFKASGFSFGSALFGAAHSPAPVPVPAPALPPPLGSPLPPTFRAPSSRSPPPPPGFHGFRLRSAGASSKVKRASNEQQGSPPSLLSSLAAPPIAATPMLFGNIPTQLQPHLSPAPPPAPPHAAQSHPPPPPPHPGAQHYPSHPHPPPPPPAHPLAHDLQLACPPPPAQLPAFPLARSSFLSRPVSDVHGVKMASPPPCEERVLLRKTKSASLEPQQMLMRLQKKKAMPMQLQQEERESQRAMYMGGPMDLRVSSQLQWAKETEPPAPSEPSIRQFGPPSIAVERDGYRARRERRCMAMRKPKPITTWQQLASLQSPEGYWDCTEELGMLLSVDLKFFADVFLKEKGIASLGPKAQVDILRLVSTLLVLQLVRVKKLLKTELLMSLFRLADPPESCPEWAALKRAVEWVCWADGQYPCVCSRLEFGRDWESSTRQILGIDQPHPHSPLTDFLKRNTVMSVLAC